MALHSALRRKMTAGRSPPLSARQVASRSVAGVRRAVAASGSGRRSRSRAATSRTLADGVMRAATAALDGVWQRAEALATGSRDGSLLASMTRSPSSSSGRSRHVSHRSSSGNSKLPSHQHFRGSSSRRCVIRMAGSSSGRSRLYGVVCGGDHMHRSSSRGSMHQRVRRGAAALVHRRGGSSSRQGICPPRSTQARPGTASSLAHRRSSSPCRQPYRSSTSSGWLGRAPDLAGDLPATARAMQAGRT